jgi:AcrR family transcriptional regulator
MGRPRQIDRPSILGASLAIADQAGLAAVTMQAVAERMGVTPMALYRHVEGKAALLDGLVESLLTEITPLAKTLSWQDQLIEMGTSLRAIARRHPSVFPLLLQRPATTPGARRVRARVYAALRAAGVSRSQLQRVERIISTLALGFAAGEASGRFRGTRASLDAQYRALAAFIRAGIAPFRTALRRRERRSRTPAWRRGTMVGKG